MEEERWISRLKGLNVLPLIVCFLASILILLNGFKEDILFALIPVFCLISYFLIYFIIMKEEQNMKVAWILASNLISTVFWLLVFSAFSIEILTIIGLGPILVCIFIIGYPLIMLYYNFRLFMNEISKPLLTD